MEDRDKHQLAIFNIDNVTQNVLVVQIAIEATVHLWAVTPEHRRATGDALRELLHARDWLALQLEKASEMITDAEFVERSDFYWKRQQARRPLAEAREMAHRIFEVADVYPSGEELSVMLNCTVRTANEIVGGLARAPKTSSVLPEAQES